MPPGDETAAAAITLEGYARRLINDLEFKILEATGSATDRAKVLADLSARMSIYALRGNKRGVEAVVGRVASEAQALELELSETGQAILETIGAAVLDAASYFLPLLADQLTKRLFPDEEVTP